MRTNASTCVSVKLVSSPDPTYKKGGKGTGDFAQFLVDIGVGMGGGGGGGGQGGHGPPNQKPK